MPPLSETILFVFTLPILAVGAAILIVLAGCSLWTRRGDRFLAALKTYAWWALIQAVFWCAGVGILVRWHVSDGDWFLLYGGAGLAIASYEATVRRFIAAKHVKKPAWHPNYFDQK